LSAGDGAAGRGPGATGRREPDPAEGRGASPTDSPRASADEPPSYSRPAPPRPADDELADRIRSVGDPAGAETLTDGVVRLRTWTAADAPAIVAGLEDGSAAYWIVGMPHPYGPAEASDFLARAERELASAGYAHLAVTDAESGRVLGAIGLHFRHDRQTGEIGYWVSPRERGRGVASRAVAIVTRWGFEQLELPRLELIIHPLNHESQMIASRCGFRREGLLRSYLEHRGERNDYYCFARLPDDPEPSPQPVLRTAIGVRDAASDGSYILDNSNGPAGSNDEEIVLRPWRLGDAQAAVDMIADDSEILRWCVDIDDRIDLTQERTLIAEGARMWCEHGLPRFAIVAAGSDGAGGLLGSIDFEPPERRGVAELGYLVAAEGRDRGIATAALSAVTRWALEEGGLEACELLIDPANTRSVRVAEKAGYARVSESVVPRRRLDLEGAFGLWRRTASR